MFIKILVFSRHKCIDQHRRHITKRHFIAGCRPNGLQNAAVCGFDGQCAITGVGQHVSGVGQILPNGLKGALHCVVAAGANAH